MQGQEQKDEEGGENEDEVGANTGREAVHGN